MKENPLLAEVEAMQKCYKVLDLICEKCMKQREMNEVLAIKMHYISCVFKKCILFLEQDDKLDGLIKRYVTFSVDGSFPYNILSLHKYRFLHFSYSLSMKLGLPIKLLGCVHDLRGRVTGLLFSFV